VRHVEAKLVRQRPEVLLVAVVEDGEQQPVLGPDVVQQAGHGQPAGVRDILHRQRPEAALADQARGHVQDLPPALRGGQPRALPAVGPDGGVGHQR
jgi:hypothetical protein